VSRADTTAPDGLSTSFDIDDSDPESSVPTAEQAMKRPLDMGYHIMMLSERAQKASETGDYEAAARYWRAMTKAVPDMSLPRRRLCAAYEATGDLPKAIESCRSALALRGVTVQDSEHYVKLLLAKPVELDARDIADVEAIAAHLEKELGPENGPPLAKTLQCQLAVRIHDPARLETCSNALWQLRPKDPETLVYAWTLAVMRGDLAKAEKLIAEARAAQMPRQAVSKLEQQLRVERERRAPWWMQELRDGRIQLATASAVLLAVLAMFFTRKRNPRQTG
jgi:hypothetical protein